MNTHLPEDRERFVRKSPSRETGINSPRCLPVLISILLVPLILVGFFLIKLDQTTASER
jgi:hypothetical protein